jgi:hypothetical protein
MVVGPAGEKKGASDKIQSFLADLKNIRVSEFIADQVTSGKEYGLDNPSVAVTLARTGKEPLTLALGSEKKGVGYHFRAGEGGSIYLVPGHAKDKFTKKPSDFEAPPPPPPPPPPTAATPTDADGTAPVGTSSPVSSGPSSRP